MANKCLFLHPQFLDAFDDKDITGDLEFPLGIDILCRLFNYFLNWNIYERKKKNSIKLKSKLRSVRQKKEMKLHYIIFYLKELSIQSGIRKIHTITFRYYCRWMVQTAQANVVTHMLRPNWFSVPDGKKSH